MQPKHKQSKRDTVKNTVVELITDKFVIICRTIDIKYGYVEAITLLTHKHVNNVTAGTYDIRIGPARKRDTSQLSSRQRARKYDTVPRFHAEYTLDTLSMPTTGF